MNMTSAFYPFNKLLSMKFAVPPLTGYRKPRIWTKTGTFDLSTNKNIKFNFDFIGDSGDIDCSVNSAGHLNAATAKEVAAAINTGLSADATYGARLDYNSLATVRNGKVFIEAPYRSYADGREIIQVKAGSSLSALGNLFVSQGASPITTLGTVTGYSNQMSRLSAGLIHCYWKLNTNHNGQLTLSNPYLRRIG